MIPQDGTFNQIGPVTKVLSNGSDPFVASCDMSSATDRLPVELQSMILSHKFGYQFALHWKNLLTSRGYKANPKKPPIYYAVGQPMGALSSWAMLALTHHFL